MIQTPKAGVTLADRVRSILVQRAGAGLVSTGDIDGIITRLEVCASEAEAVDGAGFVSEATVEDIGIKQTLFARLEQYVDRHTILANNTSTYPMTQIAGGMTYRDRALVTHPFNPPHLLPVVKSYRVRTPQRPLCLRQ